jgi:hypothetical protein
VYSFKIRSGLIGRPGIWKTRDWNWAGFKKKTKKVKNPSNSANPMGLPGQKPGYNLLTIYLFLTKTMLF